MCCTLGTSKSCSLAWIFDFSCCIRALAMNIFQGVSLGTRAVILCGRSMSSLRLFGGLLSMSDTWAISAMQSLQLYDGALLLQNGSFQWHFECFCTGCGASWCPIYLKCGSTHVLHRLPTNKPTASTHTCVQVCSNAFTTHSNMCQRACNGFWKVNARLEQARR